MKHSKARFFSGKSWKDPETVGLNVALILCYVVGLIFFQKAIGLIDRNNSPAPDTPPAYTIQQGNGRLKQYSDNGVPSQGVMFRHLLQSPAGEELEITTENHDRIRQVRFLHLFECLDRPNPLAVQQLRMQSHKALPMSVNLRRVFLQVGLTND